MDFTAINVARRAGKCSLPIQQRPETRSMLIQLYAVQPCILRGVEQARMHVPPSSSSSHTFILLPFKPATQPLDRPDTIDAPSTLTLACQRTSPCTPSIRAYDSNVAIGLGTSHLPVLAQYDARRHHHERFGALSACDACLTAITLVWLNCRLRKTVK
jgi:hypothetical protein